MTSTLPIALANTQRVDFRSKVNGRQYSMQVALPLVKTLKKKGCPVLYVLDGYWYFASAVEVIRANAPDVVVVGIGYPDDRAYVESVLARHRPLQAYLKDEPAPKAAASLERMYDLSLPVSDEIIATDFLPDCAFASKDLGGLDGFLKTLETE